MDRPVAPDQSRAGVGPDPLVFAGSPLALPDWRAFQEAREGVRSSLFVTGGGVGDPIVTQALVYVDRRGRIVQPRTAPYAVLLDARSRGRGMVSGRRLAGSLTEMARRMRLAGFASSVALPPDIADPRPWLWCGFTVEAAHTILLSPENALSRATRDVRRQVAAARSAGVLCSRSADFDAIERCLKSSEAAQDFDYTISGSDLRDLAGAMSADALRFYLAVDVHGEPASARVVLAVEGGGAIDWLAGTVRGVAATGGTHLAVDFALQDLAQSGIGSFDFAGANIPSVAYAKAGWGGRLTPYYRLGRYNIRGAARWTLLALRARRAR